MTQGHLQVDRVWKRFRRGRIHDSLRDLVPAMVRSLWGRNPNAEPGEGEFWAVRDLSFAVGPGDTLGIIGHNGAGKSTVLKLLTRVFRPTRGSCRVSGRIGALVEIAAGFHPDLTGRENVHLQGAIMGMSGADVNRKFADIVAFSGIGDFIDTPVKRYSSGMHARLGFSIAAHLDPDVLIIDEILSVGDLVFQTQAFGRIRELATSGRPVVVVSHQMSRIEELCSRVIVLDHGALVFEGPPREAVARYVAGESRVLAEEGSPVTFDSVLVQDGDLVHSGDVVRVAIKGHLNRTDFPEHVEPVAIAVKSVDNGMIVSIACARDYGLEFSARGAFSLDVSLQMNVMPGRYAIHALGWDKQRGVALATGPSASVFVKEGAKFLGLSQLNASMTLATPALSPESNGDRHVP